MILSKRQTGYLNITYKVFKNGLKFRLNLRIFSKLWYNFNELNLGIQYYRLLKSKTHTKIKYFRKGIMDKNEIP